MNAGTQDVSPSLTATGTTQATALLLINGIANIGTVASGSGVLLFSGNPGTTQTVYAQVTDVISGAVSSVITITTDIPTAATMLSPRGYVGSGATSSVIGLTFCSLYIDPLV